MNSVRTADRPAAAGERESLVRMVGWAQDLLAAVLVPGDLAIDLTAGTGRDTLFLFRQVGPAGRILAFDIQATALAETARRLEEAGAVVDLWRQPPRDAIPAGVHLIHESHASLDRYLFQEPAAVVANFGYLPGGDPTLTTRPDSSLAALEQALRLLRPGGRLAVGAYVGHAGAQEEAEAVSGLFAALSPRDWLTLRLEVPNRPASPFLLVAEKRRAV